MEERSFGPVRFLPCPNKGKYPHCHSLFIEGAGILIDPFADRQRLSALRERHAVRAVWLSHWHEDHFMHLDLFDDVPLAMHAADARFLENIEAFLDGYGIEDQETRDAWKPLLKDVFHFRPRRPQILLPFVEAWIVYRRPREPLAFYRHAEQALMGKHLEALMGESRVVREDGCYRCT